MIPQSYNVEVETITYPSFTYRLDHETKRIHGYTDGFDAVVQAAQKIIGTERFAYAIYTAVYGIELESLIGQNHDYVITVLETIFTEALTTDDRILSITDFVIHNVIDDEMHVSLVINTIYGSGGISLGVAT